MSDFFNMNPIAIIAMTLLILLLIGSAEHTYMMMTGYFKWSFVALLVVLAIEIGVLVVAWQKGANVMRLENSTSLTVFNFVVILNVFFANLSQSFEHKYTVAFNWSNIWSLDWISFIMWFSAGASVPVGVMAMTHVISKNFSKKMITAYKSDVRTQPDKNNSPSFDINNSTVDELKEQLQKHFNKQGINVKITDAFLAEHLNVSEKTIQRKRKAERQRDEDSESFTEVRFGTNGSVKSFDMG